MGWPFRIFLGGITGVFLLMSVASYQGWGVKPLGDEKEKEKAKQILSTGPSMRGVGVGGRSRGWGK